MSRYRSPQGSAGSASLASIAGQLPAALGPATPVLSLSTVAAQGSLVTFQVPVTTTPRALIVAWVAATTYAVGEAVTNDSGKVYVCITAGESAGSGGPTGTGADITDNAAHWSYVAASATAFKGSMVVQVIAASANTVWYGTTAALSKGGKEIGIGGSGEAVFVADATALYLYTTGTATASVAAYV